jgi:hypothetical protein
MDQGHDEQAACPVGQTLGQPVSGKRRRKLGVSRVMRKHLMEMKKGRATGGVSAVGKPGTASQFQRRELVAVPALRRLPLPYAVAIARRGSNV